MFPHTLFHFLVQHFSRSLQTLSSQLSLLHPLPLLLTKQSEPAGIHTLLDGEVGGNEVGGNVVGELVRELVGGEVGDLVGVEVRGLE